MTGRFAAFRAAHAPLLRYAPTRRVALLVALVAPLWLLPVPLATPAALAALAVIGMLMAVDAALLPRRGAVRVEREAPPSVGIGDEESGRYVVANPTARRLRIALQDALPPLVERTDRPRDVSARGGDATHDTIVAPPMSQRDIPFTLRGQRRGAAPLGDVGLQMVTAWGLVSARDRVSLPDEIRVLPSVSAVRRIRLLAMQHRLDLVGVRALRRKGEGQGFANLREYVPGDEPRHIDWKATARRGKFITREYTIERSQTVVTLIDAGRAMTQLAGRYSRFEQALSASLVLTDIASAAGDRVGSMVFDDEVRAFVPPLQSRGSLRVIRDAYVPVVASSREPDYANAFRFLAAHQRKRSLVVLFTDVIDVRASRALLAHVAHSASRHLTLVVALRNDELHAAARPRMVDGTSALDVYRSAAAEEVIQARAEALERMRRTGVVVVDASPAEMAASVVNRYLELKSRGAL